MNLTASIVTYNSDPTEVLAGIASLHKSAPGAVLCVVDNGSTNGLVAALENAAPEVNVVRSPKNGGFGYGHNLALQHLPRREYHFIMNPDILLHDHAVGGLVDFMNEHPEVLVAGPLILSPDGSVQPVPRRLPTILDLFLRRFTPEWCRPPAARRRMDWYQMGPEHPRAPFETEFLSGSCLLLRRSALDRKGGFDEQFFLYFEDADLIRRLGASGHVVCCPASTVTHTWGREAHQSFRLMVIMLQSATRYFRKWGIRLY